MKNLCFPTTIVDGFFTDPDVVREFALKQDFFVAQNSAWPGRRSKHLHQFSLDFFETTVNKILSIYFDLSSNSCNWEAEAYFQIVDKEYECGWVHLDSNCLFTALIYLSKGLKNSGTTLYKPKDAIYCTTKHVDKKHESFNDVSTLEANRVYREDNNNQYVPTVTIEGEYNRLALFDSHYFHAANDFSDGRLTLIVNLLKIMPNNSLSLHPVQRMHRWT
jgi:hypothetical protein